MLIPWPIGGFDLNLNSKQSRAKAINCYVEAEGEYYSVKGTAGLTEFVDTTESYIRSDFVYANGLLYFVAGFDLYSCDRVGNLSNLGTVGGAGRCEIEANNIPGDSQIAIINGNGQCYIYQPSEGLDLVVDADFYQASYVTVFLERFWFPRDGTNQFFGSAVSDGTDYPTGTIATAETAPDNVVATIAHKGALYVVGEKNTEYWQSISDATLPVRPARGAVFERGCAAVRSIRKTSDSFCFFADDYTVQMISGSNMSKISNLAFELEVRGDGTYRNQGYSKVDDAFAFYVDSTSHKVYYITFPTEGVTWGYDLINGLWHKRKSSGLDYWQVNSAINAFGKVIVGSSADGKLYYLDNAAYTEDGSTITRTLVMPSMSWQKDVIINSVEIDMETGVGLESGANPLIAVRYSSDGGNNWTEHSSVSVGTVGDYSRRVVIQQLGRVVRNRDFMIELTHTAPVEFRIYRAWADIEEGI